MCCSLIKAIQISHIWEASPCGKVWYYCQIHSGRLCQLNARVNTTTTQPDKCRWIATSWGEKWQWLTSEQPPSDKPGLLNAPRSLSEVNLILQTVQQVQYQGAQLVGCVFFKARWRFSCRLFLFQMFFLPFRLCHTMNISVSSLRFTWKYKPFKTI